MAEINSAINELRRAGVRRAKKHLVRTDMTPMVDLGFLLITFFVITTEMRKPVVTKLNMPKEEGEMPVGETDALTVLLSKNNSVYYYFGKWDNNHDKILKSSLSYSNGIGDVIRKRQKELDVDPKAREGRRGLMLIIKPDQDANYSSLIDMLDEALINNVGKYVVTKPNGAEIEWLRKLH
jgi:biopolymer transport protein ExbD